MTTTTNQSSRLRLPALPAVLGPKGLDHAAGELPLVAASVLVLALICAADITTPVSVVFGGLALLVMGLDAWLLGVRSLAVVLVAAIAMEGLRTLTHSTSPITAVIDSVALTAAAGFAHIAATNSAEVRRSREHQLSILLDTARALNETADIPEVYARVLESAARFVAHGDPRASLWRLDEGGIRALAERDVRGEVLIGRDPFPLTAHVESILDGTQARSVNVDQLGPRMAEPLQAHGVRSMALAPIRVEGGLYGAVSASSRDATPFTNSQLEILTGLADLAGIAIAKALDAQRQRDRARVLDVLRQVLIETATAGRLDDVAQRIVSETSHMLDAEIAVLALRERGRAGIWIKASTIPIALAAIDPQSRLGRIAEGGEAAVIAADQLLPGSPDAVIAGEGHHLAAAPVLGGEGCLGVLAAAKAGSGVSDEQLQLLALLASQLGSAIEAAELRGELIESERAFRSLCAGLGCAAVLYDATGQPVEANWAAENLTGVPVSDIARSGAFGPDWKMRSDAGTEIPLGMRPPAYVVTFDRPLVGLIAEVTVPGRRAQWLRIDSNPILEAGRLKWIVTTFYPVPGPSKRAGRTP